MSVRCLLLLLLLLPLALAQPIQQTFDTMKLSIQELLDAVGKQGHEIDTLLIASKDRDEYLARLLKLQTKQKLVLEFQEVHEEQERLLYVLEEEVIQEHEEFLSFAILYNQRQDVRAEQFYSGKMVMVNM